MFLPLERRRFNRLIIPLPVSYQTLHPESGELHRGHGVIRDISLSGSFFHIDHQAPLQTGQILSLTIAAHLPFQDDNHLSHLYAQAEVVRLEPPGAADCRYGVAVNFLQHLAFATA
jgi:hypothetical protein